MRERLAGLVGRRSTREEEVAEKVKATEAALQDAHRERQVSEGPGFRTPLGCGADDCDAGRSLRRAGKGLRIPVP